MTDIPPGFNQLTAAASPTSAFEPLGPECECWPTPESEHFVYFGATEPGSAIEFNPDCPTHRRDPWPPPTAVETTGRPILRDQSFDADRDDWCERETEWMGARDQGRVMDGRADDECWGRGQR